MSELLLELYSEEIPALMQKKAEKAYFDIFTNCLNDNEITFDQLKVFVGSRRIAVHVNGLPNIIPSKELEFKGPKIDAPLAAIDGFCKSNGIARSELTTKLIKEQEVYVYIKKTLDADIKDLLIKILPQAINEYVWPKSMYWGDYDIKWVRPLKNILCIFDGEVLPIKFGHLVANDLTFGHRFISPSAIKVSSWSDYQDKLKNNHIILDREKRQNIIVQQLKDSARSLNLTIKDDEKLLEEVTGLVEWPVVMIGKIPERFLKVPQEALVTSMKTHQKYFSFFDDKGHFAPYFGFVSNVNLEDHSVVIAGNEKVLSARLADALYFYEQDLTKTLESRLPKLEQLIFHESLGSLKDKTERVRKICEYLAPNNQDLQLAAKLYKSDLVSEMVGEFPELQGIMGYYYALNDGVGEKTARAIRDHYKPLGPSDPVPTGDAAWLALADKMDSLVGLMLAGEAPTGSGDPFALRRLALGIIRIILENQLSINLIEVFNLSSSLFSKIDEGLTEQCLAFLEDRAKFYLKSEYDISLVNATLDLKFEDNILITSEKLLTFRNFFSTKIGADLVTIYKRIHNLLGSNKINGHINRDYLLLDEEKELFEVLSNKSTKVESAIVARNFEEALSQLSDIALNISSFFDNVLVKDNDPIIANNRLLLLQEVKTLFNKIVNFDKL